MEFNELDLQAVAQIQEMRVCTVEEAKTAYRKAVQRLANPDVENRHEVVLDNLKRSNGNESAEPEGKKKMTRNEKRLAARDAKEAKEKAKAAKSKKVKAAKVAKKAKVAKPKREPVPEIPLPELSRDVELIAANGFPHVYTANLFGRKHAVVWAEIDHNEQGANSRFGFIGVSVKRLDSAKKYGKGNDLPVAVCATVRVKGRLDQGYAIPLEAFEKFKLKSKNAVTLSKEARAAYADQGWAGVKFSEAKAVQAAA